MRKYILLLLGVISLASCKPDALDEEALNELEITQEDLMFFVDEFVNIGLENGYDYTYIYDQSITIKLTNDFDFGHNGQSWGINKDRIEIYINAKWFKRQKDRFDVTGEWPVHAYYIMFHELAHDVLNLKHKHNIRLMNTKAVKIEEITTVVLDAMEYARDQGRNSGKETDEEFVECEIT